MPKVLEPAHEASQGSPGFCSDESDEQLERLALAIDDLRQRLISLHETAPSIGCFDHNRRSIPAIISDDSLANEIDVLRGQLYELAWQICALRARTLTALKLKARVLAERCDDDHCDVIAALARSISRDILTMPKWTF